MCRYLNTEQVIGNMFIELLKKNIREISFEKFINFEKNLDKRLREDNNTIICMSTNEIYSAVEQYNRIFNISEEKILLRDVGEDSEISSLLEDYFKAGLPKDISDTVETLLPTL